MESELAAEMYCDELLDGSGSFQYLDRSVSVSALDEDEDASIHQPRRVAPQELLPQEVS